MKRIFHLLLFLALLAGVQRLPAQSSGADFDSMTLDRLEVNGDVFSKIVVTDVTATDVFFNHQGGFGSAKLKKLSPELQKRFGFDPQKAAEREKLTQPGKKVIDETRPATLAPVPTTAAISVPLSPTPEDRLPSAKQLHAKSFMGKPSPSLDISKWVVGPPPAVNRFFLIEFWATWCPTCKETTPLLNQLSDRFSDRLSVVAISQEPESTVQAASDEINFYIGLDPERTMHKAFEVKAVPHVVLIDPQGIVRWEGFPWQAGYELTPQIVEDILKTFAAPLAPSPTEQTK